MDEQVEKQVGNRIFTVIDLKKGFHQIVVNPKDRHLPAMNIGGTGYQWKMMPMGIMNGPSIFQKCMDYVLKGLDCASCYIDDVIVGSRGATEEEMLHKHGTDVEKVLSRLREHGLVAELSKVSFFSRRVEFCGHGLENGTRRPAEGKLVALAK